MENQKLEKEFKGCYYAITDCDGIHRIDTRRTNVRKPFGKYLPNLNVCYDLEWGHGIRAKKINFRIEIATEVYGDLNSEEFKDFLRAQEVALEACEYFSQFL